jgi:hypothetical protein
MNAKYVYFILDTNVILKEYIIEMFVSFVYSSTFI